MTSERTFRILTATSTATVAEAARLARSASEVTDIYGRLLTGAALLQLAQSPIDRLQCSIEHNGTAGMLTADIHPGPTVRGRVEHASPPPGPVLGADGVIRVSRQPLHGGQPYEGLIPLSGGSIAGALQQYCIESEQVLTLFELAVVFDPDGQLEQAAGMIVQALPGAVHEHLSAITRCLEASSFTGQIRAGVHPFDATQAMFQAVGLHHLGNDPLEYRCGCSKAAALDAVKLLGPDVLAQIRQGREETVVCEFCRTPFLVTAVDLGG